MIQAVFLTISRILRNALAFLISSHQKGLSVGVCVDNAGLDFVSDLCFMSYLIHAGAVSQVTFYVKKDPVYDHLLCPSL